MLLLTSENGDGDGISTTSSTSFGGDLLSLLNSPDVQRHAEAFASSPIQAITSNEVVSVLQGEVAVANHNPSDGPAGLGSDSATTCHIVAFRNPTTGRSCLAHLDSPRSVDAAVASMLRLMSTVGGSVGGGGCGGSSRRTPRASDTDQEAEEPLDLYIVGGYLGKSCSEELSIGLLSALHRSRRPFRVVLACMARLNSMSASRDQGAKASSPAVAEGGANPPPAAAEAETQQQKSSSDNADHLGWLPRRTGLALDIATGRAYPVRFEGAGRGPGWLVRCSRIFSGSREEALTEIYDSRTDSIIVSPFHVFVDSRWLLQMLVLPDHDLLAQTSTSPEAEDERFVADIRAQFSFMVAKSGAEGRAWFENIFGGGRGNPLVFPRAKPTTT